MKYDDVRMYQIEWNLLWADNNGTDYKRPFKRGVRPKEIGKQIGFLMKTN